MKKNKKKNLKKVQAKINNTPVKAEASKKEVSKIARENNKTADKGAKAAANKAAKAEKQAKKYAASKARIEARKARKKSIMDKLLDSKKTSDSSPTTITLEQRKERQENRRKVAYNRHISSIQRRCKRMKLTEEQTLAIVDKAKAQWDNAKQYDLIIVYESSPTKKADIENLVKDAGITVACITGSTAFLKNVPKESADKVQELFAEDTVYQYRTEKESLFKPYIDAKEALGKKTPKKGGLPHSRECSKSRNIAFYNIRRLKKAEKDAAEKAKPVNKKPTQVKEIKSKSNKQAA